MVLLPCALLSIYCTNQTYVLYALQKGVWFDSVIFGKVVSWMCECWCFFPSFLNVEKNGRFFYWKSKVALVANKSASGYVIFVLFTTYKQTWAQLNWLLFAFLYVDKCQHVKLIKCKAYNLIQVIDRIKTLAVFGSNSSTLIRDNLALVILYELCYQQAMK